MLCTFTWQQYMQVEGNYLQLRTNSFHISRTSKEMYYHKYTATTYSVKVCTHEGLNVYTSINLTDWAVFKFFAQGSQSFINIEHVQIQSIPWLFSVSDKREREEKKGGSEREKRNRERYITTQLCNKQSTLHVTAYALAPHSQ